MGLVRCVYVSLACLDDRHADAQLRQIVDHAVAANGAAQITGVLLSGRRRFAQLIEGPAPAVGQLADRLAVDPRHRDVVFLKHKPVKERLFDRFSLAYHGPSVFVERSIAAARADHPGNSGAALRQLIQLMREFAR